MLSLAAPDRAEPGGPGRSQGRAEGWRHPPRGTRGAAGPGDALPRGKIPENAILPRPALHLKPGLLSRFRLSRRFPPPLAPPSPGNTHLCPRPPPPPRAPSPGRSRGVWGGPSAPGPSASEGENDDRTPACSPRPHPAAPGPPSATRELGTSPGFSHPVPVAGSRRPAQGRGPQRPLCTPQTLVCNSN